MKTPKIIFILLLPLLLAQGVKGQGYEFAPIGATWYYSLADNSIPYPHTLLKYMKIVSTADTIIDSKTCRILEEFRTPIGNFDNNLYLSNRHYIYFEYDKVYYYVFATESFDVLYDYSKIQQEYWLSYFWGNSPDCDTVRVHAVSDTIINGHTLKSLSVSQNSCLSGFFYNDYPIIEVIGHLHYLFPQSDFPVEGPLRCYEDSVIGFYSTGLVPYCDYIGLARINEFKEDSKINIFPNPFSQSLTIKTSEIYENVQISIFDMYGRRVFQMALGDLTNQVTLDLPVLPIGNYILKISTPNELLFKQIISKI